MRMTESCQPNNTETAMSMHATETYGLSRSPTLADFQKNPVILQINSYTS